MEGRSLEHGLAQKLMILENAAARVATVRAQLRTNIDQVRFSSKVQKCLQDYPEKHSIPFMDQIHALCHWNIPQ